MSNKNGRGSFAFYDLLLKIYFFTDQNKTSSDVKKEGEILTEMLEIVAKRDSLIALLEEKRQRWRKPSCPTSIVTNSSTYSSVHYTTSYVSHSIALIIILFAYVISFSLIETFINYLNGPQLILL